MGKAGTRWVHFLILCFNISKCIVSAHLSQSFQFLIYQYYRWDFASLSAFLLKFILSKAGVGTCGAFLMPVSSRISLMSKTAPKVNCIVSAFQMRKEEPWEGKSLHARD